MHKGILGGLVIAGALGVGFGAGYFAGRNADPDEFAQRRAARAARQKVKAEEAPEQAPAPIDEAPVAVVAPPVPVAPPPAESLAPVIPTGAERLAESQRFRNLLPAVDEVPQFVTSLSDTAQNAGLQLRVFQKGRAVQRDGYVEIPLEIGVRGTFRELMGGLRALADTDKRLLNVRAIRVARRSLNVERVMEMYAKQDGPAASPVARLRRLQMSVKEAVRSGVVLDVSLSLVLFTYTGVLGPEAHIARVQKTDEHASWDRQRPLFLGTDDSPGFVSQPLGPMIDPFEPRLHLYMPLPDEEEPLGEVAPPSSPVAPLPELKPVMAARAHAIDAPPLGTSPSRTFEQLKNGRRAILDALLFLSWVHQRVDADLPDDTYRVLSDVWPLTDPEMGERPHHPVWLTAVSIGGGEVVIRGEAKEHEHVSEFITRLQTGVYFTGVEMVRQAALQDPALHQPSVEFELHAGFNEDPNGLPAE